MRRFRLTILSALAIVLLTATASAQSTASASVPNLIRYSGTLKDAPGAALASTAPVGVTFAIYNQEDGGAPVWQETQNVTLSANGQYSVILGSTTATGLPDDLFSPQEQRWLGVQVQGQEEQARVLLVSVPYALKAHEADTLGGMPASTFIQAATLGAAGITSTNGTSVNALSTTGTPPGARGKDGKLPPNGCLEVSGYITYWDVNGALCPSMLFQVIGGPTNGYIGIGTLAPSTALDVNGITNTRKWYDIAKYEWAFAGVGFQAAPPLDGPDPTKRDTFVGVRAGTANPAVPPPTPTAETDNTFIGYSAGTATTGINNTFTGSLAGVANVSGVENTFTGAQAGNANTASNNSFYGFAAGLENSNGTANAFFGSGAGLRNNGNNNTYLGYDAAFGVAANDENGNNNTITGFEAGFHNTASNVAFYGYKAGAANTANGNSFYGYSAGTANNSGSSDTFLGNLAGTANLTGNGNTFLGDSAGAANTAGNNNTFTGQNAGAANTANGNSFYGYNSGPVNNTGIQNVFMGWQTGLVNSSGFSNVFMGYQAGQANVDQSYNTFVGANAGFSSNAGGNTLIGYSAGSNTNSNTGYGITAVGYDAGRANTTGTLNAYFGGNAGFNGVGSPPATGSQNTYLGNGAGSSANLGAGSNNIFVGFAAGNAENAVSNEIDIGNAGPAIETPNGPNIIIGVQGLQTAAYLAGITPNPPPMLPSVLVDTNGRLWQGPAGSGLGGTCNTPGSIAEWLNPTALECSVIYQQASTNYIGIGTLNPSAALDVNGDISAKLDQTSYQIAEKTVLQISGTDNLFVGVGAGTASGGTSNNTFAGFNAGNANTATGNSFFGYDAGLNNTSGNQNTFVGISAGSDNTTGAGNTYVGWEAGFHGAPGTGTCCNTFVGNGAGLGRTAGGITGAGNTCTGHRACEAVSSGAGNSAYGYQSGLTTTTGDYNAFYGTYSGTNNTTGMENTYLGYQADSGSNAGNNNIHVGYQAGSATANGGNNIEIGNVGASTDAAYIRIGTMGAQVNNTYIAGFAASTQPPNVYYNTTTGQLFATTGGGGGGGIGPCSMGANWITRWTSTTTVDCSHINEVQGTFNVGIDGVPNAKAQLDVVGGLGNVNTTDTTSAYMIGYNPVLQVVGPGNLAVGVGACPNSTGGTNTCVGGQAGMANGTGYYNTFVGGQAGASNTTGFSNTFVGEVAGQSSTAAQADVYVGAGAGQLATGSANVFIGGDAGYQNTGAYNIFVGLSTGQANSSESNTIRIGAPGNISNTYIQGINSSAAGTTAPIQTVCVDGSGKLWGTAGTCNASSRRFKDQIADMGDSSSKLFQLRPVSFFYKPRYDDGTHAVQYGLIAEEVAKVYPEMAVYDKDGQPSGVKYQLLAPMLLNELQKEHAVVMSQQDELQTQLQQINSQRQEIDSLKHELVLQNASMQERLQKLESYVATQIKTASEVQTAATTATAGGLR